MIYLRGTS